MHTMFVLPPIMVLTWNVADAGLSPVAHLVFQSWQAAAETNTLLRWVHTTNGEFNFVGHSGRQWEEFLKMKLDREIPDHWKSAEFLKIYLKDRLDELEEVSRDIQKSSKVLFS